MEGKGKSDLVEHLDFSIRYFCQLLNDMSPREIITNSSWSKFGTLNSVKLAWSETLIRELEDVLEKDDDQNS